MALMTEIKVCVYCSSSLDIDEKYIELASNVGKGIAERGWRLVSGGGNISMMGAVAQGARSAGGHTLGIIPQALMEREVGDTDADELIIVDDMRVRKGLMESHSNAFLALPGGIGTLEELFEIWVGRYLSFHSHPVVVLDPYDDFAFLHSQIDHLAKKGFIKSGQREILRWTKSVDEALDACESDS